MRAATGETISEGGFQPNKVSAASLLDVQSAKDKNGKTYYKYEILTRSGERPHPAAASPNSQSKSELLCRACTSAAFSC